MCRPLHDGVRHGCPRRAAARNRLWASNTIQRRTPASFRNLRSPRCHRLAFYVPSRLSGARVQMNDSRDDGTSYEFRFFALYRFSLSVSLACIYLSLARDSLSSSSSVFCVSQFIDRGRLWIVPPCLSLHNLKQKHLTNALFDRAQHQNVAAFVLFIPTAIFYASGHHTHPGLTRSYSSNSF